MTKTFHQTNRHDARPRRDTPALRTFTGRVRSVTLTPSGHAACVLDTSAGRLRALSDAATVHMPVLGVGLSVEVVLLRIHRNTWYGSWDWQLLACRGVELADGKQSEIECVLDLAGSQQ